MKNVPSSHSPSTPTYTLIASVRSFTVAEDVVLTAAESVPVTLTVGCESSVTDSATDSERDRLMLLLEVSVIDRAVFSLPATVTTILLDSATAIEVLSVAGSEGATFLFSDTDTAPESDAVTVDAKLVDSATLTAAVSEVATLTTIVASSSTVQSNSSRKLNATARTEASETLMLPPSVDSNALVTDRLSEEPESSVPIP